MPDIHAGRGWPESRASFLSGAIRHGLNDFTTVNASAELAPDSSEITVRGGAAVRATRNMTLELTPAVSHTSSQGSGSAVDAGIDSMYHSASFGLHFRTASPDFIELGNQTSYGHLRTEWAAQASAQFGYFGSLGLVYAQRRTYEMPTTAALTATYNVSLRGLGAIGVFASHTRSGGFSDVIAGISFTRYLGRSVTASATGTSENGGSTVELQVGKTPPPDAGWGWELAHARGVNTVMSVSGSDSRVFVLRLGERDFVPAGAEVVIGGRSFPVGTQGLAQLPIGRKTGDGLVSWPGGRCRVKVPARDSETAELDCGSLR